MQGIPHLRMRRLNPSQARSCGVMSTSTSPVRRRGVLGRTAALGSFADSCGNTTPKEWQRRRREDSTRQRRVLGKLTRFRRLLAACSRPPFSVVAIVNLTAC